MIRLILELRLHLGMQWHNEDNMSQVALDKIKTSKRFYVTSFRTCTLFLYLSLLLNLIFGLGIYYSYFHKPLRTYYATNGVTAPERLAPMAHPNNTSYPLLPPDPVDDLLQQDKALPE